MNEIEEMKSDLVKELASMLMRGNSQLTMDQALGLVFNSETYQKLLNDKTQLYFQSAGYIFSYLQHELKTGKMG
ncbi:MAG: hypothetical protein HG466_001690 [Prevotella sp.]|jgi:hypothetical protein|nr:hypothetical protein [Prevotella sp.]MBB1550504.1 hypothetical protein [Prevotella sp.]